MAEKENSIYQKIYYVDKSTNTFADILTAYGLAHIIDKIVRSVGQRIGIRVRDDGPYYTIDLNKPLQQEWVEKCQYFTAIPLIVTTDKKGNKQPLASPPMRYIDYKIEEENNSRYFKWREQISTEVRKLGYLSDLLNQVESLAPLPEWQIYNKVNRLFAVIAYDKMVMAWHEGRICFSEMLETILKTFWSSPNDFAASISAWNKIKKSYELSRSATESETQVYNPASGKGTNNTKATWSRPSGQNNFWLVEYLKLVGMFYAGMPRVVSGSGDRKTYVLIPCNIELNTNRKIFKEFNNAMRRAETSTKMDILAVLRYTQVFLKQWQAGQLNRYQKYLKRQPGNYIQGLAVVSYKDMGKAYAVLNQSIIGLPEWLGIVNDRESGRLALNLIAEHMAVINQLGFNNKGERKEQGEEFDLLQAYRNFLSSGNLRDFFKFTGIYSSYLTSKIEEASKDSSKRNPKQFTINNLEVLIMSHDKRLKPILESDGFQRIATAIRRSTVQAQYFRYQQNDKRYDIRYGLGQDLIRKGKYKEEFVKALGEFLAKYNHENGMVEEQTAKQYGGKIPDKIRRTLRSNVRLSDIEKIVDLIDEYKDSELICNLLVACGYAADHSKSTKDDKQSN